MKTLPREVNVKFVTTPDGRTHNVLEVCSKDEGVRYVMAQDSETAKERDRYKLRAHLQQERIEALEQPGDITNAQVDAAIRAHNVWTIKGGGRRSWRDCVKSMLAAAQGERG